MSSVLPQTQPKKHNQNNFDFLRFFLATVVLVYHSFPLLWLHTAKMATPLQEFMAWAGYSAVDGFFIISGYLVTNSWVSSPDAGGFLRKRALRIYPGYLVAMLICAFFFGPLCADDIGNYVHQFPKVKYLISLVFLDSPAISPVLLHNPYAGEIDGSCWTIRYEFICYLFVLTAGLLGMIKNRRVILGLFAVITAAYIIQVTGLHTISRPHYIRLIGDPKSWIRLSCLYLAGMTAYLYKDKITYKRWAGAACILLLALAYAVHYRYAHALFPMLGTYALFAIAFDTKIPLSKWSKYGDFSYGIYLYAFPVQQTLIMMFRPDLNPWTLTLITFPITLGLAFLSWKLVESTALKLKPKSKASKVELVNLAEPPSTNIPEPPDSAKIEPPAQMSLPLEPGS